MSLEQNNNMSSNRRLRFQGVTKTLSQWADVLGVDHRVIRSRLYKGWPVPAAFTTPVRPYVRQ